MQIATRHPADPSYASFREFYPAYLAEHASPICRRLHVVGLALAGGLLLAGFATGHWFLFWGVPVVGYGLAWFGHFVFEKNRPATLRHPVYSLIGDFAMVRDVLRGRIPF
jgi:hypothetical protein